MWNLSRWASVASLLSTLVGCGAVVRPPEDGGPSSRDAASDGGVCVTPGGTVIPVGGRTSGGCSVCECISPGQLMCGEDLCEGDAGTPEPVCIAPDRSAVPIGGVWSSPDECTRCECRSLSSTPVPRLECVSSSDCPSPPMTVCRAPDGTLLPEGMRWRSRDGCTTCECSRAGLACSTLPGCEPRPEPPPEPPPEVCNAIPSSTTDVMPVAGVGELPLSNGGTLENGLYTLSSMTVYGGRGAPVPMGGRVRWSMQIDREIGPSGPMGAMRFVAEGEGMPETRVNFAFSARLNRLNLQPICGRDSATVARYTATSERVDLVIPEGTVIVRHLVFMRRR
jgi:hypothetical protein